MTRSKIIQRAYKYGGINTMTKNYQGTPVSTGIAIGKILKLEKADLTPETSAPKSADEEKGIYKTALENSTKELEDMLKRVDGEKKDILEAHLSILTDPMLEEIVFSKIDSGNQNVEQALQVATDELSAQFLALDDEYMRERAADIQDESARIMRHIKGCELIDLSNLEEEVVVIARDLTPSDTATMDLEKVLGFATDLGGRTSHTAIMARNMGVPAVVACIDIFEKVSGGELAILDGESGKIVILPNEEQLAEYKQKQQDLINHRKKLQELLSQPTITQDGHQVELACNIGNDKESAAAIGRGAESVGLFRTEFLYMESTHFPTEEEQFEIYKCVAQQWQGKPVIIRTLDIGGDKSLSYFSFPEEMNPFLGYRAVRLCLDKPDIFKVQLRSILRASAFGKIRIMFPFIISVNEWTACIQVLEECKEELKSESIAFDEQIEVGIMVETPASVVMADILAKHVDFFSIGTNDLTQYTLAVDRGNELIQEMYNPFHPAVLRSIRRVIDASHAAGKWTGMCGEFAGEKSAVKLLLGMGLDEFSMSISSVLEAKAIVCETNYVEAQQLADQVMNMETTEEIMQLLDQ